MNHNEVQSVIPATLVATFSERAAAERALGMLHQNGFAQAWLAVTAAAADGTSLSVVDEETGGGKAEHFVRSLSGDDKRTVHSALVDHGVSDKLACTLDRDLQPGDVVVVSGKGGDFQIALRHLESAGGTIVSDDESGR